MGIGRSIHTGFSLLLDGSDRVDEIIRKGINWDVMGGVARRSWARNAHSLEVAMEHNAKTRDSITLPYLAEPSLAEYVVEKRISTFRPLLPEVGNTVKYLKRERRKER